MNLQPPTPFAIAIDTREQSPLQFPEGTPTVVTSCYPADYSLVGNRYTIAIERKGVSRSGNVESSDLVGTITAMLRGQNGDLKRGSLRFRWELLAMSRIIRAGGIAFVAVEKPRSWYERHEYFGGLDPRALFATIRSLEDTYGVPFKFYDDTAHLTVAVFGALVERWKHLAGTSAFPAIPIGEKSAVFAKWEREWAAQAQAKANRI